MDQLRFEEGVRYAERNCRDTGWHLWLDKRYFQQNLSLDGMDILDFGCGMGGMSMWCATHWDCQVLGVDIDANHLAVAERVKEIHQVTNATFERRDVIDNPLEDRTFDLIILNDVVEHISLPLLQKILNELARRLRPNGKLFVSYPPWEGPYASHLNHMIKLPWCQFMPHRWLHRRIEEKNYSMVGEKDIKEEYFSLNHLTHARLKPMLRAAGLVIRDRKSHTLVNRLPGLQRVNFNVFPFNFLVTKELLLLNRGDDADQE